MKFSANAGKYNSIAAGYANRVQFLDIKLFDSFSLFNFKKQTFGDNLIILALIYCCPKL